jgi:hypothetical protein
MARYAKSRPAPPRKPVPADLRIRVTEIVTLQPSPDGSQFQLLVRDGSGGTIALDMPLATIKSALDRFSRQGEIALSATTDDTAGHLAFPPGGWSLSPRIDKGEPVLACRAPDGMGFDLGVRRDPVTAVPRVAIAVDL